MARDEFTEKTKRDLRDNVGSRCSKPDCRVPTMAPSNNIGVAAHICAASKGGPRYDNSMTSLQRKSIENGIWLCENHATEIDKNPDNYSKELLNEWKKQAEESAIKELGRKLPSDTDAINMVSSALTGNPTQFIPNAIPNIHLATEKSLEKIDSRFFFKTKYSENMTTIICYAKENISLSMKIDESSSEEYSTKFKKLMEHGEDLTISSTAITIKGSQLFEEIITEGQTFSMAVDKKPAIQKIWLTNDKNNMIETLDDVHGLISLGSKSLNFQGSALNQIFNFKYKYNFDKNVDNNTVSMSLSLDRWDGLNIDSLPYFTKILSFFSKLFQGWRLNTRLEVEGENIIHSDSINISTSSYLENIYSFLLYTQRCRAISKILDKEILFISDIEFSAEEHQYITKVLNILEGKEVLTRKDINNNPMLHIIMGEDAEENIKLFENNTKPNSFKITHPKGERIKLFAYNIELQEKIIHFDSFFSRIHTKIDDIKCGDSIKIEIVPEDDFKYSERYNLDLYLSI